MIINTFPKEYIRSSDKVLCLFSAAFGGSQDVRYVYDAGVKDCVMVDNDKIKLLELKFPYTKVEGDCFNFIDECVKNNEKYDVVISDQWTQQMEIINTNYLERLKQITKRVLIIGCSQIYLDAGNIVTDLLIKRSEHMGGIFWRVIIL
jgi:hypothetical protein